MRNLIDLEIQIPYQLQILIESPLVQRLKSIHQNGTDFLIDSRRNTTRYEHSLGVMQLVNYLGGSISEQAYGLLHDIKHTALSHFIDVLLERRDQDYHDRILENGISTNEINQLLQKVSLNYDDIFSKENVKLTKANNGMLGADRLDYFLRDGLAMGLFSQKEIQWVFDEIVSVNKQIVCKSEEVAYWIGTQFIKLNEEIYFNPQYEAASLAFCNLCKDAFAKKILHISDFNNSDSYIIEKLGNEEKFSLLFREIENKYSISCIKTKYIIYRKYRYLDPVILLSNKSLSEVNIEFKNNLTKYLSGPREVYYSIDQNLTDAKLNFLGSNSSAGLQNSNIR